MVIGNIKSSVNTSEKQDSEGSVNASGSNEQIRYLVDKRKKDIEATLEKSDQL
jgi:hypothetical protein